jgi:hypothetical protein
LILSIVIDGVQGVVNLFLGNALLAKLGRDNALGDLLMVMA